MYMYEIDRHEFGGGKRRGREKSLNNFNKIFTDTGNIEIVQQINTYYKLYCERIKKSI